MCFALISIALGAGPPAHAIPHGKVRPSRPAVTVVEIREATPEDFERAGVSPEGLGDRRTTAAAMDQGFCLSVVPGSICHMEGLVSWGWYLYVFNYLMPPSTHASLPPYQGSCSSACYIHVAGGGPGAIPTGWVLSGQNFASIIDIWSVDP